MKRSLLAVYNDVITVRTVRYSNYDTGPSDRPLHLSRRAAYRSAQYRAVANKKDGHMFWKLVKYHGKSTVDRDKAEAAAQALSKKMGMKFEADVLAGFWVDREAQREHWRLEDELKASKAGAP